MNISRNDNRTYQPLTLDNGLKVLLVQDLESTKSAASMAINAGHFDDPLDRQGLAHFLEHMLFLGTDLYPESAVFLILYHNLVATPTPGLALSTLATSLI